MAPVEQQGNAFSAAVLASTSRPDPAIEQAPFLYHNANETPPTLWLALDVPTLPLIASGLSNRPEAWTITNGRYIVLGNDAATRLGIVPGMRIGAAQALGDIHLQARDPVAEQQTLAALAAWCMQFTSTVSLRPPTGLVMEIGHSLTLFHGLTSFLAAFCKGLAALGYAASYATAPTPLAAHWFARAGRTVCITKLADLTEPLTQLPIDILAADERMLDILLGLGFHKIGDCLQLPRAGLAHRLGPDFVDLLDRALGKQTDPQSNFQPPEYFERSIDLLYEVEKIAALQTLIRPWLEELAGFLRSRSAGTQQLLWRFNHRDHPETLLRIALASVSRDPLRWEQLLHLQLEQTKLPAPVRAIKFTVTDLQHLTESSLSLFIEEREQTHQQSAAFLERLYARLGPETVRGLRLVDEHRPEAAWQYCAPGIASHLSHAVCRPLWLLPAPERMHTRNGQLYRQGTLKILGRSERIESGWWEGLAIARDYFIAEHASGTRYWLFREIGGDRRWFMHGLFD